MAATNKEGALDRQTMGRILSRVIPGPPPCPDLDKVFEEACKALARESGQ